MICRPCRLPPLSQKSLFFPEEKLSIKDHPKKKIKAKRKGQEKKEHRKLLFIATNTGKKERLNK